VNQVLVLDIFLLVLVAATAIAVITIRSLFSATILFGIYSLLMALVWTNMHALDVAFTEAAVGAGISTILLLGALVQTTRYAKREHSIHLPALLICIITGLLLIYGSFDMPRFGSADAPIHAASVAQDPGCTLGEDCPPSLLYQNVGKHPSAAPREQGHAHEGHPADDFNGHVPNTVTSLLAAYRSFDTMFETAVIFVAGVSLVLLLRRRREGEHGVPISDPSERDPDASDPRSQA
jgi:multicomponent Na+:H+ antiporter subunit B